MNHTKKIYGVFEDIKVLDINNMPQIFYIYNELDIKNPTFYGRKYGETSSGFGTPFIKYRWVNSFPEDSELKKIDDSLSYVGGRISSKFIDGNSSIILIRTSDVSAHRSSPSYDDMMPIVYINGEKIHQSKILGMSSINDYSLYLFIELGVHKTTDIKDHPSSYKIDVLHQQSNSTIDSTSGRRTPEGGVYIPEGIKGPRDLMGKEGQVFKNIQHVVKELEDIRPQGRGSIVSDISEYFLTRNRSGSGRKIISRFDKLTDSDIDGRHEEAISNIDYENIIMSESFVGEPVNLHNRRSVVEYITSRSTGSKWDQLPNNFLTNHLSMIDIYAYQNGEVSGKRLIKGYDYYTKKGRSSNSTTYSLQLARNYEGYNFEIYAKPYYSLEYNIPLSFKSDRTMTEAEFRKVLYNKFIPSWNLNFENTTILIFKDGEYISNNIKHKFIKDSIYEVVIKDIETNQITSTPNGDINYLNEITVDLGTNITSDILSEIDIRFDPYRSDYSYISTSFDEETDIFLYDQDMKFKIDDFEPRIKFHNNKYIINDNDIIDQPDVNVIKLLSRYNDVIRNTEVESPFQTDFKNNHKNTMDKISTIKDNFFELFSNSNIDLLKTPIDNNSVAIAIELDSDKIYDIYIYKRLYSNDLLHKEYGVTPTYELDGKYYYIIIPGIEIYDKYRELRLKVLYYENNEYIEHINPNIYYIG